MKDIYKIFVLIEKDFKIELRTKEILYTMFLFSLLLIVIFSFAFYSDPVKARDYGPGIIWATILFSATVGLNSLFVRERENDMISGILLCPMSPKNFLLSKVISHFIFSSIIIILTVPLIIIFFDLIIEDIFLFVSCIFLGIIGLSFIGVLFSSMLINARLKEILLPLVIYPILVPVIIAGVKSINISLGQQIEQDAYGWLRFMIGFDMIFIVAVIWLFERMMNK